MKSYTISRRGIVFYNYTEGNLGHLDGIRYQNYGPCEGERKLDWVQLNSKLYSFFDSFDKYLLRIYNEIDIYSITDDHVSTQKIKSLPSWKLHSSWAR